MKQLLNNRWGLSLTAGLLLGLSFPPVNLSFLSIPAFFLFFMLADRCDSARQTAYYSYAGFLFWNLITTYWLMMASTIAGVAANLANSVLMTIPMAIAYYIHKKNRNPFLIAVAQASAWVGYEFLHHHWDLSWPWLVVGNAWSNQVSLIQYISITGYMGISFWVVLTASLAYQTYLHRNRTLAILCSAIFLIPPTLSLLTFAISDPYSGGQKVITVTVAQPNHDSYQNYGGMSGNEEVLDSLFAVTTTAMSPGTDLVVWPENAIDRAIAMDSYYAARIADSAASWRAGFIVGSGLFTFYPDDTEILNRGVYRGAPYNVFNATLYADSEGDLSRYDKHNLVPVVERFPFVEFFNAVDVFDWLDWGRLAGFGKGYEPVMLHEQEFSTSGLICYDSVFPFWVRQFVKGGADFITIITNDGWWGDSSGHRQHFAYARLRAIEFDRWVVRSANNGTSGIIRPNGTIEVETPYWIRMAFSATVETRDTMTLYARYGDWLPVLCLLFAMLSWGASLYRKP